MMEMLRASEVYRMKNREKSALMPILIMAWVTYTAAYLCRVNISTALDKLSVGMNVSLEYLGYARSDDFIILTDVNKRGMVSIGDKIDDPERTIIIDHHDMDDTTIKSDSTFVDEKVSSASEIVARLMVALAKCYLKRNARGDRKRAEKLLVEALESALVVQGPDGEISLKARDMLESIL